ncbi:DUF3253 domain-containing protein [Roseobacter sinensis]|uniref:DUF3253 domain-containing protein n=1 Tax=Roseobacter sinensis TaxID=2931391 RepID=A0ABT3BH62_9RHOB|nr:DUF3253 domain-containing protein [Roseobacter sp. WL0113]MCV3272914.1 DUF3253 domain-containing protein [Roseobacter sp. WL0113]
MTARSPEQTAIAAEIRRLALRRGPGKTFCPSEVARALSPDRWRDLMAEVRQVADALAEAGEIVVTQKGRPVSACTARGPIRVGLAST